MGSMRGWTAVAVAAVTTATAACASSTGPTNGPVGQWTVTITGMSISPSPFTLTISQSGQSFEASYPDLTWTVGPNKNVYSTQAAGSSVAIHGDSLLLNAGDISTPACPLVVVGAGMQGKTASGTASVGGGMCQPGSGTWSAQKK